MAVWLPSWGRLKCAWYNMIKKSLTELVKKNALGTTNVFTAPDVASHVGRVETEQDEPP